MFKGEGREGIMLRKVIIFQELFLNSTPSIKSRFTAIKFMLTFFGFLFMFLLLTI